MFQTLYAAAVGFLVVFLVCLFLFLNCNFLSQELRETLGSDSGLEGARPECLEPLAPHFLASQHVMYGWNVFTKRKAKAGTSLARAHVQVSQVQVLFQRALTGLK